MRGEEALRWMRDGMLGGGEGGCGRRKKGGVGR